MSLINDALKRASASMKKQPPSVPGAPLEPAPDEPKNSKGVVFLVIALLIAGGAGYGIWSVFKPAPVEVVAKNGNAKPVQGDNKAASAADTKPVDNATAATASTTAPEATPATGAAKTGLAGALNRAVDTAQTVQKQNAEGAAAAEKVTPPPTAAAATPPQTPTVKAPVANAQVAAVTGGAFPDLSLQGIYFRLNKPSARISGKTVYVGDDLQGAKVKAIQRRSVTVEFAGQTKELSLAGN